MSSRPKGVVWDPLVRVFHWLTATLIVTNYWLLEAGEDAHEWVGYVVLALLAVRILWGFIGSSNARFVNFWPTPARLTHHWRELRSRQFDPAQGHNPAGAVMILLLMTLIAVTAISGWMQDLDYFWGEDWVEQLHEYAANTLMAAAAIHVCAVVLMSRYSGLGLVRTMVTGKRPQAVRARTDK